MAKDSRGKRARVLVVGGGYAGALAAVRVARAGGANVDVTLASDRPALVQRIRLHEAAATGRSADWDLQPSLESAGARFLEGCVDELDVGARVATVRGKRVPFDRLILALGTAIDRDAIAGAREHALALDPGTTAAVHEAVSRAARAHGRVVVVGGGLTGLEIATEIAEHFPALRVSLVTAGQLGEQMCERATEHVREACARLQVDVHENDRATRIERGMVFTERRSLRFDVCIASPGFVAPEPIRRWGLRVDETGRARTDATLRCEGASHVWAVGDCAALPKRAWLPGGCKTAMPMGAHAADEVIASFTGASPRAFEWSDSLWCTSLGRADGVIQVVDADGTPTDVFLRGRAAASVKEAICRMTVRSIELEAQGWLRYRWRRPTLVAGPTQRPPAPSASADGHP
jgi:NADH dehydrogenase